MARYYQVSLTIRVEDGRRLIVEYPLAQGQNPQNPPPPVPRIDIDVIGTLEMLAAATVLCAIISAKLHSSSASSPSP